MFAVRVGPLAFWWFVSSQVRVALLWCIMITQAKEDRLNMAKPVLFQTDL